MEGGDWEGVRIVNFKPLLMASKATGEVQETKEIHSMLFIYRHYSFMNIVHNYILLQSLQYYNRTLFITIINNRNISWDLHQWAYLLF